MQTQKDGLIPREKPFACTTSHDLLMRYKKDVYVKLKEVSVQQDDNFVEQLFVWKR